MVDVPYIQYRRVVDENYNLRSRMKRIEELARGIQEQARAEEKYEQELEAILALLEYSNKNSDVENLVQLDL